MDKLYVAIRRGFNLNDTDGVRLFLDADSLRHFVRCNSDWVAANGKQPVLPSWVDKHGNPYL